MACPKRKLGRILKISAVLIFFVSGVLVFRSIIKRKPVLDINLNIFDSRHHIGHLHFDYFRGTITFSAKDDGNSYLSVTFPEEMKEPPDMLCETKNQNDLCLKWMHKGKLEVREAVDENARCYNIVWTPKNEGFTPFDCFSFSNANWYGGSAHRKQKWPLNRLTVPLQAYVSSPLSVAKQTGSEVFGPVLERFWFSSKGVGIFVDNSVPLHVSVNESNNEKLCLKASFIASPYQNPENLPAVLRYFVCKASNARTVHQHMYKKCFHPPASVPDEQRMKEPMWTSSMFQEKADQSSVLTYTNEIANHEFPKGFFEIYGNYFRAHGDYNFDEKKFPNAHQMIGEMKASGFEVGTWITPQMDVSSMHVEDGKKKGYFILGGEAETPAVIDWNGNKSLFIDFTNKQAVTWFHNILEGIKNDYKNTAFIFNSGEASFFDLSLTTKNFIHNPCEYSTKYVEFAHSFGVKSTVKVGYQSQKYPLFIEIPDRESGWSHQGGLKSIIPTVLTYGLLGYPFINPGPIGGRGHFSQKSFSNETFQGTVIPDAELYVRWLSLAAYLPIMQFSFPPWEYSKEVVHLAHELVELHKTKVFPLMMTAAKETQVSGAPIIRPVWWIAPNDETALSIDCEFLVGDDLLVAPVLDKGARSRKVYIPSGSRWRDNLREKDLEGGQWLEDYKVELLDIPTFSRLKEPL